ncbi:hypothetical protein [Kamptonema formosum]|uniref:hypothetical protein n=1 Tax=Kamptonema formosum TaxID=331992 RepID=UPI00034DC800|nr:hypothetical protein [Oscillatoria sp. PCC 10802]
MRKAARYFQSAQAPAAFVPTLLELTGKKVKLFQSEARGRNSRRWHNGQGLSAKRVLAQPAL